MKTNVRSSKHPTKLITRIIILSSLCLSSFLINAQDKNQQIDVAFSKLTQLLPANSELIAQPYTDKLVSYGQKAKSSINTNSDAIGGKSFVVDVKKSLNAYDAGVTLPLLKEINKGDVIYMMFFAKAKRLPKNQETIHIPSVSVQQSQQPYSSIFSHKVDLTTQWQSFAFAAKADKMQGVGSMQASFQIASGDQEIEFGPVFIFNVGQSAEVKQLPYLAD